MPGLLSYQRQTAAAGGSSRPAMDNDDVLVEQAQRDPRHFAPLYARYFDPVYRYCYRRLERHDAAADATSLVFARALAALPRYRTGSFRSWLFTIAHNVVVNRYRDGRLEQSLDAAADLADRTPTPEEQAVAAEGARSISAALANLSSEQRQVVELRLAGLNDREIAETLGRSLGSVKMLQVRAVARLRVLLGVDPALGEGRHG